MTRHYEFKSMETREKRREISRGIGKKYGSINLYNWKINNPEKCREISHQNGMINGPKIGESILKQVKAKRIY